MYEKKMISLLVAALRFIKRFFLKKKLKRVVLLDSFVRVNSKILEMWPCTHVLVGCDYEESESVKKPQNFNIIERQIRLYFPYKYLPNDFITDPN